MLPVCRRLRLSSCLRLLLHPSRCPLWLVLMSPLVRPPPLVRLRLHLSSHRRLSSHPSHASYPAVCRVTSHHATASRPPAPLPIIVPSLRLLSGWLLRCLSSRRHLPSACASASHCITASHRAPLTPLIRLVVVSPCVTLPPPVHLRLHSHCTAASHCAPLAPLVRLAVASPHLTLPPPVRLRLRLSLHRRFSPRPSRPSCPAGYCVTSRHAATSRPPALPPLIVPLSHLLSGWLLRHLSARHHRFPLCRRLSSRPSCASCLAGCCNHGQVGWGARGLF
jgi:hypothetical protein